MVERKSWEQFRETGLLVIINQILHIFGWAIVCVVDKPTGEVMSVYPARVKFRGFDNKDTSEAYEKISKFMAENSNQLLKEATDDEG